MNNICHPKRHTYAQYEVSLTNYAVYFCLLFVRIYIESKLNMWTFFLANQMTDLDYPRITPPSMPQPSRSLYPTAKILPPARLLPPTKQNRSLDPNPSHSLPLSPPSRRQTLSTGAAARSRDLTSSPRPTPPGVATLLLPHPRRHPPSPPSPPPPSSSLVPDATLLLPFDPIADPSICPSIYSGLSLPLSLSTAGEGLVAGLRLPRRFSGRASLEVVENDVSVVVAAATGTADVCRRVGASPSPPQPFRGRPLSFLPIYSDLLRVCSNCRGTRRRRFCRSRLSRSPPRRRSTSASSSRFFLRFPHA
jgi:hypothetical protein